MHYDQQTYRPPMEGRTPLLQVATGCSWNQCSFCTMYNRSKFTISPLEEVEADLQELLGHYGPSLNRIFLTGGDPFIIGTDHLLALAALIKKYFPSMETITCYASIRDLSFKSLDELKRLRQAGYDQMYIGLETGYEPALTTLNKGATMAQYREQLTHLQEAGMDYGALIMLGVGGAGTGKEAAQATVDLLNDFPPFTIFIAGLCVSDNSPLGDMRHNGTFKMPTERQMLEEQLLIMKNIKFENLFFGAHPYNLIPVAGMMPKDTNTMIAELEQGMASLSDAVLDSYQERPSAG